jgi:hypothetical protein
MLESYAISLFTSHLSIIYLINPPFSNNHNRRYPETGEKRGEKRGQRRANKMHAVADRPKKIHELLNSKKQN